MRWFDRVEVSVITYPTIMTTLFLDTETTGLSAPPINDLVEVGIVDEHGTTVFHSLCNPGHPIPGDATKIHGITDPWLPKPQAAISSANRSWISCAAMTL